MTTNNLFLSICALLAVPVSSAQQDAQQALVTKVKNELAVMYFDEDKPSIETRLRALGDPASVSRVVLDILVQYKSTKLSDPNFRYFSKSVFALGKLLYPPAIPSLIELANCRTGCWDEELTLDIRISAVQSVGQIDPAGNVAFLLEQLHDENYAIRRAAAEGLSESHNTAALTELDVQAAHEFSRGCRQEMQGLADKLRQSLAAK